MDPGQDPTAGVKFPGLIVIGAVHVIGVLTHTHTEEGPERPKV